MNEKAPADLELSAEQRFDQAIARALATAPKPRRPKSREVIEPPEDRPPAR